MPSITIARKHYCSFSAGCWLRACAATPTGGLTSPKAHNPRGEYNTADATLWFAHAIDRHVAATGDLDLAAALLPVLDGVVKAHVQGTRYGIGVDPADELLTQGQPGYALTWMDARIDGIGVTPRIGAVGVLAAPLLTPLGLRSLAPGSPGYHSRHRGGPRERDGAYHQGTVWPWLIGPYVDACRRTGVPADGVLDGLVAH